MQIKKYKKNRYLLELYSSFYLNKVSLIIFLVAIILLILIFISSTAQGYSDYYYQLEYESIARTYFQESFFALTIISAVFSIFLGSLEGITSVSKLDALLVCNYTRSRVLLYKCLAFLLINWLFQVIIFLMLFIIPVIFFDYFIFKKEYLSILMNMLIWGSFITLLSMFISMIIQNYFSTLLMFVIFFITKIMSESSNKTIRNFINALFPQLIINEKLQVYFTYGSTYVFNIIVIIYFVLMIIYKRKSLKVY